MMPTTQQVLASMQLALKEHVEPNLADKWAQSALRSVDALLTHLQARVPVEGPMLHADTQELLTILTSAQERLGPGSAELDRFVSEAPDVLAGYASVEALQALNHRGREAVDALLRLCHDHGARDGAGEVLGELKAYLGRHADRESSFFFPVFVGRPV